MLIVTLVVLVGALAAAAYGYAARQLGHWARRGVPHPPARLFFGHLEGLKPSGGAFRRLIASLRSYRDQGLGYCGVYMFTRPVLAVWEPEMIKQIVTKDFSSFHDRPNAYDKSDPLSAHLFNMHGDKWRNLRNKLSPVFASGKLKLMFPLIRDIGDELSATVAKAAEQAGPDAEVELMDLVMRFATDVIGSCAFGIQCNCLRNENKQFMEMAQGALKPTAGQVVRFALQMVWPPLTSLVPMKWIFPEVHRFFLDLMNNTVRGREERPVARPDFVQLIMQLRDQDLGQADPEHHVDLRDPGTMAAQGFIFFVAGLDNVAYTLGFALSRLAADAALQERVAAEVRDVLARYDGELSYEALREMALVHNVVREALRLWQPIGFLMRKCNKRTRVGDLVVEKGDSVFMVSVDSAFPDSERFDPDRHSVEAAAGRHPYSFLPFGEGPRLCIAERFAMLEMKLAVALLVRDFRLERGPRFEEQPVLVENSFLPKPENGFYVSVRTRQ